MARARRSVLEQVRGDGTSAQNGFSSRCKVSKGVPRDVRRADRARARRRSMLIAPGIGGSDGDGRLEGTDGARGRVVVRAAVVVNGVGRKSAENLFTP
jgi:hypothetical protein